MRFLKCLLVRAVQRFLLIPQVQVYLEAPVKNNAFNFTPWMNG